MNELAELTDELVLHQARLTPLGLELPETITMSGWAAVGRKLCRADQVMQWWLGDWAAFGLRKYEEEKSDDRKVRKDEEKPQTLKEFAEGNGIDYQTLRNYAWVSRSIPLSRRRDKLEWSFHAEVAALDPNDQTKWLDKVESEGLARAELRRQMRTAQGQHNALASDGPQLKFASKAFDDVNRFLRDTPEEFWQEPSRWPIWLERLRAAHDRFVWLKDQIESERG